MPTRFTRRPLLGSTDSRDDVFEVTDGRGRLVIDADVIELAAGDRPIACLSGVRTDDMRLADLVRLVELLDHPQLRAVLRHAVAANKP